MRFSEIEERMDLLLQAFNSMSNGVVVIGKEGEVLVANKSALSLLSLDDSVIGRSFGDALPDSHLFMRETDSQHQAEAMVTLGTAPTGCLDLPTISAELTVAVSSCFEI